ncbi:hypothetical protein T492DRAFT_1113637 [Pavlovales sp. CCMP2436]|nr:hypothetical protein T492DRAFT_1113637 [Pavlovales sp. CCMP2436]
MPKLALILALGLLGELAGAITSPSSPPPPSPPPPSPPPSAAAIPAAAIPAPARTATLAAAAAAASPAAEPAAATLAPDATAVATIPAKPAATSSAAASPATAFIAAAIASTAPVAAPPPPTSGVTVTLDVTLSGDVGDWDASSTAGATLRDDFCNGVEDAVNESLAAVCTIGTVSYGSVNVDFQLFFPITTGSVAGSLVSVYVTAAVSTIAAKIASKTGLTVTSAPSITGSTSVMLPPSPPPPMPPPSPPPPPGASTTSSNSSGGSGSSSSIDDGSDDDADVKTIVSAAFGSLSAGAIAVIAICVLACVCCSIAAVYSVLTGRLTEASGFSPVKRRPVEPELPTADDFSSSDANPVYDAVALSRSASEQRLPPVQSPISAGVRAQLPMEASVSLLSPYDRDRTPLPNFGTSMDRILPVPSSTADNASTHPIPIAN